VVVAINYRLGPLGFLALPELEAEDDSYPTSGNYGFEDQRAALEWVKANIAAFGGDPERVAVFGESAGGISTCLHMVSPGSEGLFERTMIQSGPCDTLTTEAAAHEQGAALVEAVGCASEADVLACMRSKTTAEIIEAIPAGTDFLSPDAPNWGPVLDGVVFPDHPAALFEDGQFADVPTIVGANADEATLFFTLSEIMVPDEESFLTLAEALVPGRGEDVVAQYPPDEIGSAQAAAVAAVGDAAFVCPARRTARRIAAAGGAAYLYHFTYGPQSLFGELGAFHSAEIKFVLGVPSQLLPFSITAEEQPLVDAMMGYWYRHAASGDPNGEGAVAWPRYAADSDEHLVLDLTISTGSNLRKELCDFWDGVTVSPP
jgi:para-nitrobenzyl esterase